MPKLPGISRATAVRVLTKIGFRVAHEGKHTVMSNGRVRLTIPRHNSINPFTMASIAKDAGLTPEQFRELM
jgi:predicted RNA binding protein YcfA (HicA-like mRNA interferase family)